MNIQITQDGALLMLLADLRLLVFDQANRIAELEAENEALRAATAEPAPAP